MKRRSQLDIDGYRREMWSHGASLIDRVARTNRIRRVDGAGCDLKLVQLIASSRENVRNRDAIGRIYHVERQAQGCDG